jgi:hypothetical protein
MQGIRFAIIYLKFMWPIILNPENVIEINYQKPDFPASFLAFKPILFKTGQLYCCLLGPNLQEGIFGMGYTVDSAITQWNLEFKRRLILKNSKKDTTAQFVAHKIRMQKKLNVY